MPRHSLSLLAVLLISIVNPPLVNTVAPAAETDSQPAKPHECRFTELPIAIDGKGDEKAWKTAEVIDQFSLPWLGKEARPAKTATKARLLWDRDNLYFFAEMVDSDLYADVTEHDGDTWNNDVFELFFKPAEDKPGYYEFQVNAKNTVFDMFLPRRGHVARFRRAQEFHIESKVLLDGTLNEWTDRDKGWSVEGKIPWRDFIRTGGRPAIDEVWKFVLCRYDYGVDFEGPELSWCSPKSSKPNADFHRWEDYAELKFIGPDKSEARRPFGIEKLEPLTTSKVLGSPEPPAPYQPRKAFPKLKLNFPIFGANVPGSDWMLAGIQPRAYAPATLIRFRDNADVDSFDKLLELPEMTIYNATFHPKFAENGFLYIGSTGPASPGFVPESAERFKEFKEKSVRITRYRMDPQTFEFDPKSATLILEWESNGHSGADCVFGNDGMLYVTSGDGTSDSDLIETGQGLDHLLAKVLRIDVDHPDPGKTYSVPKDNPFVSRKDARPETWAYGFRNPWRITCDRKTGDIWVGNNGQDLWEQTFRVERGANYGWSVMEGSHVFYADRKRGPTPFVKPTTEHSHSEARSLTGGVVYHGEKLLELSGAYIYGDHSTGKIWGVKHNSKKVTYHRELVDTPFHITHFCLDSHGELLVLDHQGEDKGNMYYLEPNPDAIALSPSPLRGEGQPKAGSPSPLTPALSPKGRGSETNSFPRRLSESGLFASVKEHAMQPGLIPYSVNAALWSDGAHKARWLAIPHDPDRKEPPIDMSGNRGWNLPDDTVLVKSFALDLEAGKPESRRWIETRFLVKQQGEWFGYSYEWNDEQTDGVLVENAGKDREFTIRDPQAKVGIRKQTWHYPSRTECMICHSRAANFVLGLSTLQFNRNHDYGGIIDSQLRVLEHLGLVKLGSWQEEHTNAIRRELQAKELEEKELDEAVKQRTVTRDQRGPAKTEMLAMSPESFPRLVDPYDKTADLTARARSYLHANCSICHVEAGGGNAQMQLEYFTPLLKAKMFDEKPLHHKFDLTDPRIIAPGHPERSVLLTRISRRGPSTGQMPQLATSLVDREAVELFREWIEKMPDSPAKVEERPMPLD